MSTRAARAFLPALRALERELEAPIADRVSFLRELEYDLEELQARFVAGGATADEARRRAIEALVPDRATVAALGRLHAPLYRRMTRRIGERRLRLVERTALVVATLGLLLAETLTLFRANMMVDPSPYLWPVLVLGGLLFAVTAAKVFEVWVKRDHRVPRRHLGTIVGLSVTVLLAGVAGTVLDLYRLLSILERAPHLADTLIPVWITRDCALLFTALILALAGALAWLILAQWLALVSEARRHALGLDSLERDGESAHVG